MRARLRFLRRATARLPAGRRHLRRAGRHLFLVGRHLRPVPLRRPLRDLFLRRRDRLKAIPAPLQLLRNVQPDVWLSFVRLLRPGQQRCNLFPQLLLQLVRVVPAHRLCLLALALILVPSRLTFPSCSTPRVRAIIRICMNRPPRRPINRLRKAAIVS